MVTDFLWRARTLLFVPGDRPTRFDRALTSGADCVVVDLEDGVAPAAKSAALGHVIALLERGAQRVPVVVRINDPRSPRGAADITALARMTDTSSSRLPSAIMIPKTETVESLSIVRRRLGDQLALLPLIETATGIAEATALARAPGVVRLVLGHLDLCAELGLDPHDAVRLSPARFALVAASARAGRTAPVDGPSTSFRDHARIAADARESLASGFTAKLCIHPDQVSTVHTALAPSESEVAWARAALCSVDDDAIGVVDGHMVDRPVLLRAGSILSRAAAWDPVPPVEQK